jgi:hypothetical protein
MAGATGYGITGMHSHRVKILYGANDTNIICLHHEAIPVQILSSPAQLSPPILHE